MDARLSRLCIFALLILTARMKWRGRAADFKIFDLFIAQLIQAYWFQFFKKFRTV